MKRALTVMVLVVFVSLTFAVEIPTPVSFFDFEEAEGYTVYDLGSAGNNGEIIGENIDRSTGGIVTQTGDPNGCLEWIEENAFGSLDYVLVPFDAYMNSANYTYSVWMQYYGEPNWGYLFWADGVSYEPDLMDRHVDVWLNPGNNGVDCILNDVDGGQLRVASVSTDCGVELMDNDWHMVTVTLENNRIFSVYLDGVLAIEGEAEGDIVENEGDDLYIGARPNDADGTTAVKTVGLIDRVRIWDTALNADQVEALYNSEGPDGGSQSFTWAPKTFFDFEEAEGVTVNDLGSAGNNGEIVGENIDRTTGGIINKAGDPNGCLEWVEENAFGALDYVFVPYAEYMNSANYTYSAWMQYYGEPNWGYLFWADGVSYEPELMDRHIDVWFNPGNNGVDCILNDEDGGQLRVASVATDCGVELMDNDWHLVTVTLQHNRKFSVYLDGILAADGEAEADIIENEGDDLYIGARPNDADGTTAVKTVGLVDRVRIWDYPLSPSEIEYLYNSEGPDGGSVKVSKQTIKPIEFGLQDNYPNPFNPTTTIGYSLDKTTQSVVQIFDILGHKITTLYSGVQPAGNYQVQWNGQNDMGQPVSSGVYLYRLTTNDRIETRKMMLIK